MSRYSLKKSFRFEAAHHLPRLPAEHKCHRMHGHSYKVIIELGSEILSDEGWVIDFGEIAEKVKPIIMELDHRCLNDIPGLDNPTSELLAVWLWNRIKDTLPILKAVEVCETCTSECRYEG